MKISFYTAKKSDWGDLQAQYYAKFQEMLASDKDFTVSMEFDKTPAQLRGYYRLCDMLTPVFTQKWGEVFTKDMIDEVVKRSTGFTAQVGKNTICRSKKSATSSEMSALIEKLYKICEFYDVKDYKLTPKEEKDISKYYK